MAMTASFARRAVTVVLLFAAVPPAMAADITGKPRVIDGDTLQIGTQRVRLFGIDAPEAKQSCTRAGKEWRCGDEAADALAFKLAEHWLTCLERDVDRYRRVVAVCFLEDGTDINEYMVSSGWALAYRQYSKNYVSAEDEARRTHAGIWSSQFVKPWQWRVSRK